MMIRDKNTGKKLLDLITMILHDAAKPPDYHTLEAPASQAPDYPLSPILVNYI